MSQIIGFIPSRLNSTRLPGKALAHIEDMPVVIHVAKRSMLSSKIDKVIVCTDSAKIAEECKKYEIDFELTGSNFKNGTERIASVARKFDFDYAIDIQGDEPLVDPEHINLVAKAIETNARNEDIIIPTLEVPYTSPETIVRVQTSLSGRVMTLSRSQIPNRYSKPLPFVQKHLSVIGFKKDALEKYSTLEMSPNEECESIELLRALENDMRVFSLKMRGDSFSVDVQDDLLKARVAMKSDKYFGNY